MPLPAKRANGYRPRALPVDRIVVSIGTMGTMGCMEHLRRYDTALFSAINGAASFDGLDFVMQLASNGLALTVVWTMVCGYWLARAGSWRRRFLLLATLAALIGLSDASGNAVKKTVQRTRPCQVVAETRIVSHCPESPSFPSNHAANNFAIAAFVATSDAHLAIVSLAIATVVAYSRVYLGMHYPLDVLCGAAAGGMLGLAAGVVLRRFAGPAGPSTPPQYRE